MTLPLPAWLVIPERPEGRYEDLSAEGRSLYSRACDIEARGFLLLHAETLGEAGRLGALGCLMRAEVYLSDRLAYEVDKPGALFAAGLGLNPDDR